MNLTLLDLKKHWRDDLSAGFIVFMVALPLCIGIAAASGVPPAAGIIAAVIGGILGSVVSGSYVTVNGPAAGLIAIILACVEEMGRGVPLDGYRALLACTVVAGCLQLLIGWLRGGGLGLMFPSSVVHGMLAAIGVIIMAKQAHVLLGVTPVTTSPLRLIAELPHSLTILNPEIAWIGFTSLLLMIGLSGRQLKILRFIPASLLAVLVGIAFGQFFDLAHEHTAHFFSLRFYVGPRFLLDIPNNLAAAIFLPNFAVLTDPLAWKHIFMIAFVASTESILSVCAVDKLDPQKRHSNLNRELMGKGACNALAGAVGGLPMIAEIVRSSANIVNGARTQWSNFFHGLFLLLFIAAVPQYLHLIPLACLSAILVYVGYNLARPAHLIHAWRQGSAQGLVFTVTLLTILATDLLVGVIAGTCLEFAMNFYRNRNRVLFRSKVITPETEKNGTPNEDNVESSVVY